MTRQHLPRQGPAPSAPTECSPAEDFGSNAARALDGAGTPLLSEGARHTASRTDDDVTGTATVEGRASVLDDGLTGDGKLSGKASGKTADGLSFDGEMALGGGLVARARALPTDDPDAVCVVVEVGVSAGFDLSARGAQDSARAGLKGSVSGKATQAIGRVVSRAEAGALLSAWEDGALGPWFDTFGALAAIGRFAGDAADANVADLNPGEFLRRTSAVDASVCVPLGWRGGSVSVGASHHGQRTATVEALPGGALAVEVAFDSAVTRTLDGGLVVGEVALGAGLSDAERVGLTVRFAFDRDAETADAERVLGAPSAEALDAAADALPWAVVSRAARTGEGASVAPRVGVPGVAVTGEHARDLDETVSSGEGLDGTAFRARSSDGVSLSVGGQRVLGTKSTASFSAEVDGGEVTALVGHATEERAPGRIFGVTPLPTWSATLVSALVHDTRRLFALDLSEADVEQLVRVRPLHVEAWNVAGFAAGSDAGLAWQRLGHDLRDLDPPEDWVADAGFRVACLAAGVRLLAAFVAGHDSRAWKALYGATRRFGVDDGRAEGHAMLGEIGSWPPGTEALEERYDRAMERKATLADDLDAVGDLDAGREIHRAVAGPLHALGLAVTALDVGTPEGRLWQADVLERLAAARAEVEWEFAMFQRRFAECDRDTGEDLALGVADGRQREEFVLLDTMRSYAALERGVFDDHRGAGARLEDLQRVIQPLHRSWHAVYARWEKVAPEADPARAATPDWWTYRETLRSLLGSLPVGAQTIESLMGPSMVAWRS